MRRFHERQAGEMMKSVWPAPAEGRTVDLTAEPDPTEDDE